MNLLLYEYIRLGWMMEFKKTAMVAVLVMGSGFTGVLQAALFDRGNGMVYDTISNITIASDANLFRTQAAGNANLVSDIIAANSGGIYDTPNLFDNGVYTLTASDFNASSGQMDWWGAQGWIGYLNKTNYDGYSNWSLPITDPLAAVSGQMVELFYSELGGAAGFSIVTRHTNNTNYNLFTNIKSDAYWYGTEYLPYPSWALDFFTSTVTESGNPKSNQLYALAVHPGDVSAVPIPAAIWLFTSGLGLFAFNHRRKNQNIQIQ
jgi:hypothetical protein